MTLASIGCQNNVVSLLGATVADVAGVCRVACSVLTTLTLIVTFYAGRYVGIRWFMDLIYEEMEKSE